MEVLGSVCYRALCEQFRVVLIPTFVIASSKIGIGTSWQWNIAIILHIHDMVPIFHFHLIFFQTFGDIWKTIL
jgi:hypothetical protein